MSNLKLRRLCLVWVMGRGVAALGLVFAVPAAFGQDNGVAVTAGLDALVPALLQAYEVPGASVACVDRGRIVYSRGFGLANTLLRTPVERDTVFQAASLGKPLAAYVALELAGDGVIDLDRPAAAYLGKPWTDEGPWALSITVRQLLDHTSGLSNSLLPMDHTVHYRPGSRFSYSGAGYTYLTEVIEGATGIPFDLAAAEYLFDPIGMTSSSYDLPFVMLGCAYPHVELRTYFLYCLLPYLVVSTIVGIVIWGLRRASHNRRSSRVPLLLAALLLGLGATCMLSFLFIPKLIIPISIAALAFGLLLLLFRLVAGSLALAIPLTLGVFVVASVFLPFQVPFDIVPSGANAAFSLTTTAEDLARFELHLLSSGQERGAVQQMTRAQVRVNENRSWGLGIGIEDTGRGKFYWHSGINPGTRSLMVLNPANRSGVVVLTNGENGLEVAARIVEMTLGLHARWEVG